MDAITINQAKQNIDGLIEQVIADAEPTIICDDKGQKTFKTNKRLDQRHH